MREVVIRARFRAGLAVVTLTLLFLTASSTPAQTARSAESAVRARDRVGPPASPRLEGPQLDRRSAEVSSLLRCPVCQGLSIADSPAPMAVNMKNQVRELLRDGYSEEQVMKYFESSYGEFVRLKPPKRGINWLVWLAPVIGLLLGVAVVLSTMRRRAQTAAIRQAATEKEVSELAPYIARVRSLLDHPAASSTIPSPRHEEK